MESPRQKNKLYCVPPLPHNYQIQSRVNRNTSADRSNAHLQKVAEDENRDGEKNYKKYIKNSGKVAKRNASSSQMGFFLLVGVETNAVN